VPLTAGPGPLFCVLRGNDSESPTGSADRLGAGEINRRGRVHASGYLNADRLMALPLCAAPPAQFAGYLAPQDHAIWSRGRIRSPIPLADGSEGVRNAPAAGDGPADPGSVRAVPDIGTLETGLMLATSDVDGGDPADAVLLSGRGHRAG
jgi:hypothetical protein